ncbi:MAG: hypothetical protein KDC92_11840, partial [Bacteroidetes bacterium]|nr:hypothetical protein [Bacteroidota bacterium]
MSSWEDNMREKLDEFNGNVNENSWREIEFKANNAFEGKIRSKTKNVDLPVKSHVWAGIAASLPGSLEGNIQSELENYEAPAPNNAWQSIDSKLSGQGQFEGSIASKVGHYHQVPSASNWKLISRALDGILAAKRRRRIATIAAVFIAAIIPSSNLIDGWLGGQSELANVEMGNEAYINEGSTTNKHLPNQASLHPDNQNQLG